MRTVVSILIAACLSLSSVANAAENNDAYVRASLSLNRNTLYERETVKITLTIQSSGVRLSQRMQLQNLPDADRLQTLGTFKELETQRKVDGPRVVETRRYVCDASVMTPGTLTLNPSLRVHVLQRHNLFIGSRLKEVAHDVVVTPATVTAKPLPPSGELPFSGAIGDFQFSASVSPRNLAVGDIVTVTSLLSGKGYRDSIAPPQLAANKHFRTYAPRQVHKTDQEVVFEQIVIPLSDEATPIPAVDYCFFNPVSGEYCVTAAGPFPIRFHEKEQPNYEQYRPPTDDTAAPVKSKPNRPESRRPATIDSLVEHLSRISSGQMVTTHENTYAHLGPSSSSLKTFEVPSHSSVEVLLTHDEWVQIHYENKRGWIPSSTVIDVF